LKELRYVLSINGYSNKFIRTVLTHKNKEKCTIDKNRGKYFSRTYVGQSSNIIVKHLRRLGKDVKIGFSSCNTLNDLFFSKTKSPTRLLLNSQLVYRVPCFNCPKYYVGETLQYLRSRIYQHKRDVEKKNESTALAEHAASQKHVFDFHNISILAHEGEIIEILKYDTVDYKRDNDRLGTMYASIICAVHQ